MTAADAAKVLALVAEEQPDAWLDVGDSYGDVFWVQVECRGPLSPGVATAIEALGASRDLHATNWRDRGETWTL